MMVMVKAFSYGLGTFEVAQLLEKEGVNYLGVANILEGVEIRKSGVKTPIMVMNPEVQSFDLMIKHQLSPVIFSAQNLIAFIKQLKEEGYPNQYPINVKIDTGMHRLGLPPSEIDSFISLLQRNQHQIKIDSVFTHLAATDNSEHVEFTNQQIALFEESSQKFLSSFDYPITRHVLNSNGIINFPEKQFDMVRLGIGLYGVCQDELTQSKLETVSTLKTKISHLIKVNKGESIGYNRQSLAENDMIIATVPMGYADGLNRLLSNGNWEMLVNGKKAKIVGNISMDMAMIDVTDIPCSMGDEVIVFGEKNTINDMAKRIKTIPYELLTIISPRVKRVFV